MSDRPKLQRREVLAKYEATAPELVDGEKHGLRVNAQGELVVAPSVGSFESYEVESGATTSATVALTLTFTQVIYRLDIIVETNAVDAEISVDGEMYGDQMKLPKGAYSFDAVAKSVKLYDHVDGDHGDVQLIGWFSLVGDPPAESAAITSKPTEGEGRIVNLVYILDKEEPVLRVKAEEVKK